ncbi:MAG: hypothetical protein N2322_01990, partial [Terrimicrobiaceae bacterium]|nr:hypothetical protein [Terrimicrobiaceae bacterium]
VCERDARKHGALAVVADARVALEGLAELLQDYRVEPSYAEEVARLRNQRVGFVFETPNLLPSLSVIENVAMPFFRTRDATPQEAHDRAREVLEFCGIWRCQGVLAGRISTAEAAAAAVARALMHSPRLIVAINPRCPEVVFPLLAKVSESFGISFLGSGPKEAVLPFSEATYWMEQGSLF